MTFFLSDWGMLRRSRCVQIFLKEPLPGPTNREHRKLIDVKTMSLGYELQLVSTVWSAAEISESELQATEKDCLMCGLSDKVVKKIQKVF